MNTTLRNVPPITQRQALSTKGLRHWMYLVLGWLFVGVAALGVMLPLLPTTPFLLLASWFFMRSNPASRDWLLRLPVLGFLLHDWERHRAVRWRSKLSAYVLVLSMITTSIVWGELPWPLTVLACCLGLTGIVVVSRLRVITLPESEYS
jgi:uncharacterized protein